MKDELFADLLASAEEKVKKHLSLNMYIPLAKLMLKPSAKQQGYANRILP